MKKNYQAPSLTSYVVKAKGPICDVGTGSTGTSGGGLAKDHKDLGFEDDDTESSKGKSLWDD